MLHPGVTGQRQVGDVIAPTMLPGHNMLHMKGEDILPLMDTAVFAAVARPCPHLGPGRGLHLHGGRLCQQSAGLLLEHRHHVHRPDVRVVFGGFLGCQQALVTFLREGVEPCLHLRGGLEACHPLGHLTGEAGHDGVEDLGES